MIVDVCASQNMKTKMQKSTIAVLTTVNAPHGEQLDAAALAVCLKDIAAAKRKPGHMSCFFGEVAPADQKEFAALHGISMKSLKSAAEAFARYSGERYPLAP